MDEDMKQIRFTIPGQPFGKQRPKFSRAGAYVKTYTPKETTSYETGTLQENREPAVACVASGAT